MEIRTSFERDAIDQQDVFLTDDEEVALLTELGRLVQLQLGDSPESEYTTEQATELAGLAFVAGRAYQRAEDGSTPMFDTEIEETGTVTVELSRQTIEALLARVITDSLRG